MRALSIVSLIPEFLGANGDSANARVLAQRARWAGFDADVVDVHAAADLPEQIDAVVIGSGPDTTLMAVRDILATMRAEIESWCSGEFPVLAVGTGWELLSRGLELSDGTEVQGLGIVAGRAVPLPARATDDVVVQSEVGRLVGFENHARGFVGAEGSPLGRIISGTGNGDGTEGLVRGSLIGTHLHGPVLARNPALADRLIRTMLTRAGADYEPGDRAVAADAAAKAARSQITVRLGLASE